jgi:hypothetical protein
VPLDDALTCGVAVQADLTSDLEGTAGERLVDPDPAGVHHNGAELKGVDAGDDLGIGLGRRAGHLRAHAIDIPMRGSVTLHRRH